jgi:hypothetical protein
VEDSVNPVHPIERLRYVARAGHTDPTMVAVEAALALADLPDEPGVLLTSVRRLIDFHPSCGPLWWVAAHVLVADDPVLAVDLVVEQLDDDPTPERLAEAVRAPDGGRQIVVVLEATDQVARGVGAVSSCEVRVVGEHPGLRRAVATMGSYVEDVTGWSSSEIPAVLEGARLVIIEASAAGPAGIVAAAGARRLADAAAKSSVPVWCVAGVGRTLPPRMFGALVARVEAMPEVELVPVESLALVIGPDGATAPATALAGTDCPSPPELFRRAV